MKNTPIEIYTIDTYQIFVKREDLAFPSPAPPFSKCRGLYTHLQSLKSKGINTVGYSETAVSMAGWAVAYFARELGMQAVIFNPIFKRTIPECIEFNRKRWKEFKAIIIDIPVRKACVNFYQGRKILNEKYGITAVMLPLGLRLQESIDETAKEYIKTIKNNKFKTIVVPVGSGTICSGIIKGIKKTQAFNTDVIGISTYYKSNIKKKEQIYDKAQYKIKGLLALPDILSLPQVDWEYSEKIKVDCPFPCHPYYDLKAWIWLVKNKKNLQQPILFWNIGSMPK